MNRLSVRLTLAFVLVTLITVAVVALLADVAADRNFRQFLQRQDALEQSGIADQLAAYYRSTGSWEGIAELLNRGAGMVGRGRGMMGAGGPGLVLADAGGRILVDEHHMNVGAPLDNTQRQRALAIVADGRTVGYLVAGGNGMAMMAQPAVDYVNELRGTLIIAALIAGSVGIVLGGWLSRTLSAPLGNLAHTAQQFGARNWRQRVPVQGAQEIANVATAFNQMADELERQEQLRRNLTADIAHELRTPLTVMQGNLRAILDGVYPLERGEIATLYDETRLLSRLVDDLRELALADAGQLPLNLQATDLGGVITSTMAQFQIAAEAQNIRVEHKGVDDLPLVHADPDRVAQILQNLLGNALRHTPPGGTITVSAEKQDTHIRVVVSDTGEGIATEDLPHVFERFYRGDQARTRGSGSTGLGLAIAKTWSEAMSGSIGVTSEYRIGSTFWFTVPIA